MNYRKPLSLVAGFAITVALTAALVPQASANDDSRTRCRSRVEKAQAHYRDEVREHGKHSGKADEAKAKLKQEWERCWTDDHAWYDPQRQEWRTEHDWDHEYDWDRDHDRDDH
jgi:hypothetical protein